jgi:peroxin-7
VSCLDDMPSCRTAFQGYSVKFSPFEEGKVAVATAQNFGIIGNGKQYVLAVRGDCIELGFVRLMDG